MLREVAGPRIAARFDETLQSITAHRWYHADRAARVDQRIPRPSFWHVPASNTLDRATAMLPGLMRKRLDEFGIDYAVVYTTLGLSFIGIGDEEMRRALCRALNKLNAETFAEHSRRMTPVALIPMGTPAEAIDELEHAVKVLKYKAVTVGTYVYRPVPKAPTTRYIDYLALDSQLDYDPVWQRCIDLGVVPA
jgi:predicted TIM-barrel fold metal-dependent hydrolase